MVASDLLSSELVRVSVCAGLVAFWHVMRMSVRKRKSRSFQSPEPPCAPPAPPSATAIVTNVSKTRPSEDILLDPMIASHAAPQDRRRDRGSVEPDATTPGAE